MGLGLAGCTTVSPQQAYQGAADLVAQRSGVAMDRAPGSGDGHEIAAEVASKLADGLTLQEAVEIALLNNPQLTVLYEDLQISRAEVIEAGRLHNPVLLAGARFPDRPPSAASLEFELAHGFLDLLMVGPKKRLAEAQLRREQARVAGDILSLISDVEQAYYELLAAGQVARMRAMIAEAGGASMELARRLHEAGNISDLRLANEQAAYEEARVASDRAAAAARQAREPLNRLLGLWGPQTQWRIDAQLPGVPGNPGVPGRPDGSEFADSLEQLETTAVSRRLDLAAVGMDAQVIADSLGIAYDWRWLAMAEIAVSSERDTDKQWLVGPTLSIELPIFDQGQGRLAKLEAQLRQAQARLAEKTIEIRSEIRTLHDELANTRELAQRYRHTLIPIHERIVRLMQEEYNYMLIGVFDVIAAKQKEYDVYQGYIEAVRDYWVTRSRLKLALGGGWPSGAAGSDSDAATTQPIDLPAGPSEPSGPTSRPAHTSPLENSTERSHEQPRKDPHEHHHEH